MSQRGLTIEELDPGSDSAVAEFYQRVLVPHFRDAELMSEEEFSSGLTAGTTMALLARTPRGTIAGGAVGDLFPRSRVLLLSYLAVPAEGRGMGTGGSLMKAVTDVWGRRADPSLFIMEVEDPRHFGRDDALGDPEARVRFYERLGARALPVPYFQPALGPAGERVRHLLLMVFGTPPETTRVDGETVELFLTEYLEGAEGPVSPDDTGAQSLLAACRRPDGLPLYRVRDLPAALG